MGLFSAIQSYPKTAMASVIGLVEALALKANVSGETFTGAVEIPNLFVNGMLRQKVDVYSGSTTLSTAQSIVIMNTTVPATVQLPAGVNNHAYRIRNRGSATITIQANGSDQIDEVSNQYSLLSTNAVSIIFFNGNWHIF